MWRFTPSPHLHRPPEAFARVVGPNVHLDLPLSNGSSQLRIFTNASLPAAPSTSPAGLWILQGALDTRGPPRSARAARKEEDAIQQEGRQLRRAAASKFEIVGFHLTQTGEATWQQYDWSKLTTLVIFGSSSSVAAPDPALVAKAAAEGVALVGEMGWACLPTTPCTWLANSTQRTERAVSAVESVRKLGLAGLNIDVEMFHGAPADFTAFVHAVRKHANATAAPFRLSIDISVYAATHPD